MLKLLTQGLLISATLLTFAACGKKDNSLTARKISRPTGSAQTQVDTQAQQLGINIDWESTEIVSQSESSASLIHKFLVNGSSQTVSQEVSLSSADCGDANAIPYNAEMAPTAQSTVYSAIGHTSCSDTSSGNKYIGLNFMAWSTQYLTQQFVLLNISSDTASMIQKRIVYTSSAAYLPDWVSSQFQSY